MAVTKQEGTVDLWASGDYFPHWVFKCDKGHTSEIPVDVGARETFHQKRLEKLEDGVCPYCEAGAS